MKVRLLNLAALAAALMGAQGLAQEGQSLERALSDLNNGYVAPAASNVTASGSLSLNISGDARVRNTWMNPANTLLPNGSASDEKNIDARIQLNMAFDVNEGASAFVQFVGSENWGTAGGLGNLATGEGTVVNPATGNLNTGVINQAYYTAYDLFGDGGEFKFGRSYFTLGSGRILATDDWNQTPSSYSGIWYHNSYDDVNFEIFMLSDIFSGVGLNGSRTPGGDVDLYGIAVDFTTDVVDFLGELTISPYVLRSSIQASPANAGVGLPVLGASKNWYGFQIAGAAMDEAVMYDIEAVWVDVDQPGAPSTSNFNAWAADVDVDLTEWFGDDIPAGINPVIELGISQADNAGITINPAYHGVAGMADVLGTSGVYGPGAIVGGVPFVGAASGGGVWNGLADTWQAGVRVEPVEDWFGRVSLVWFNDNTGKTVLPSDASEIDLSVTHTFSPSGVSMYLGWAKVDFNALSSDAYVIYALLSLPF
jgi:hypothetical protein